MVYCKKTQNVCRDRFVAHWAIAELAAALGSIAHPKGKVPWECYEEGIKSSTDLWQYLENG